MRRPDHRRRYIGQAITYDNIGNPLSDGTWNYTWKHGRQLASMSNTSDTWEYTYHSDGLRTSRSNGKYTYSYTYNGSQLTGMVCQKISNGEVVGTETVWIGYDEAGPTFIKCSVGSFQYVTNLQGDVIALVRQDGKAVVEYTYDAWGNLLSTTGSLAETLGKLNPLRYRGYVYDHETELYYLQSRYYNPKTGRFINSDTYMATGSGLIGNNMFAYCLNNPVNMADSDGKDAIYVVDTNGEDGTDGLPVVGHARVYIQDADGNWYMTEYTGEGLKFWTARPYCTPVKGSDYEAELLSILLGEQIENVEYVYLSGDFSKSYEKAMAYAKSKLGYGIYNLLVHNCHHYAIDILSAGDCDNPAVEAVTSFSPTFIPRLFYYELLAANSLGSIPVPGLNRPKNRQFTTAEVY